MKVVLKHIGFLMFLCMISATTVSQQLANWSSYYENGFVWNPALTGRWHEMEFAVTHRKDFVGFDDAPQLSTIGVQIPLLQDYYNVAKSSVGLFIQNDQVGPFNSYALAGTYAYQFSPGFNRDDVIRIGIMASAMQYNFQPQNLVAFNNFQGELNIASISGNEYQSWNPNISVGLFYQSVDNLNNHKDHWFAGFSAKQLLGGSFIDFELGSFTNEMHATLHGGFRFNPSGRRKSRNRSGLTYLEPNIMIIYSKSQAINAMAHIRYEYDSKFWLAGGIVSNGEFFGQVGLILDSHDFGDIRIGAKMDYSLGTIRPYAGVGYEFFVAYMLPI